MTESSSFCNSYFNPRSLTGATLRRRNTAHASSYFNPRSLTGATSSTDVSKISDNISIHAPLRERQCFLLFRTHSPEFQSTLPYGSDSRPLMFPRYPTIFQSTLPYGSDFAFLGEQAVLNISIHAPLRERRYEYLSQMPGNIQFQSTLPYGSDIVTIPMPKQILISIHAPLRERRFVRHFRFSVGTFQSTLPYGSDGSAARSVLMSFNFNPRSLTGATKHSIREICSYSYFNPRSLTGAT